MLIITSNRSIALIKCKHPDYNTEIKVSYHCDAKTKKWNLVDENLNYTCRKLYIEANISICSEINMFFWIYR